ncbi:MAG TPA: dihydrofolate reductase family protein [Candidatus Sulfotelmatobacter sp.]|nr:dihydrofolate reductase family protein [Candidatus Sulfotelmatobacter sp.]
MRELIADLFISLDGFASGAKEAAYFGCFGPDLDHWVRENLEKPHVILMGRVTYEALAGFAASATDEVSARMRALPKLVFSNTLREPLAWINTQVLTGDLREAITSLKQQPGDPLRTIGSIRLVRSLAEMGLVDRLRLMIFPLILGATGKEPVYTHYPRIPLALVDTKVLDSRLILLEYRPSPKTT